MKKNYLIILLLIITMSVVACTNNSTSEDKDEISRENLPTLKVISDNDSIEAAIGTSSWTIINSDGTNTSIESYSEGPIELVKDTNPLKVSPSSTIELDFSNEPEEVMVNIWEEDKQLEQSLSGMEVITPEMEGLVIYEVIATWEEGTVYYAFSVDVK